jgi:peptide subunit release factor 1 (eRF1)
MAFSLDYSSMKITCPKCGKKIEKTVGWFKADGRSCPFCHQTFDTTQFRRDIEEAEASTEKTLQDIAKTCSNTKIEN